MSRLLLAKQLAKARIVEQPIKPNEEVVNTQTINTILEITIDDTLPLIPESNVLSGPYTYKLIFEGQKYPHSVNLTKVLVKFKVYSKEETRYMFITTGHSFMEPSYETNEGHIINKATNIMELFTAKDTNVFYSFNNEFEDYALIYFGNLKDKNNNLINIQNKEYKITSIAKSIDIKFLESQVLVKKGNNTGDLFVKPIIDFSTDKYITSTLNDNTFHTFKINGKIVVVATKFVSGIVANNISSKLDKYNGNPVNEAQTNSLLEYHFYNTIKEFKDYDLFKKYNIEKYLLSIKPYYSYYKNNNSLTIAGLMGDSGSGFFRVLSEDSLEFSGIHINGCSMIVLTEMAEEIKVNSNNKVINISFDNSIQKLKIGKYIIEEVHKACQILPITQITELLKNNVSKNNVTINDITV